MRYVNRTGINIEAVLKIAAMLGFSLFFYMVIETGNVRYYVHPRIIPYMKFGILGFTAISFFMAGEVFKVTRRNIRVGRYLIFIIPLILAFALPPKTVDSDSMSISRIAGSGKTGVTIPDSGIQRESQPDIQPDMNDNIDTGTDDSITNDDASAEVEEWSMENFGNLLKMQEDTIIMDDDSFAAWTAELFGSPEKYEGKKIQIVGFVFRNELFKQNEFVPARFMISCCAADMEPIGILCNYEKALQLKKESWVKVSGKIHQGAFQGEKMPVIAVEAIEPANKPENEFVYP